MATYSGTTQVNRTATSTNARKAAANSFAIDSRLQKNLIIIGAALLILAFCIVSLATYTNRLQHENNTLQEKNEYLEAEIDSLNNQIVEETKVSRIEKIATEKYGMVYPSAENCITIELEDNSGDSLADYIKSEAYK